MSTVKKFYVLVSFLSVLSVESLHAEVTAKCLTYQGVKKIKFTSQRNDSATIPGYQFQNPDPCLGFYTHDGYVLPRGNLTQHYSFNSNGEVVAKTSTKFQIKKPLDQKNTLQISMDQVDFYINDEKSAKDLFDRWRSFPKSHKILWDQTTIPSERPNYKVFVAPRQEFAFGCRKWSNKSHACKLTLFRKMQNGLNNMNTSRSWMDKNGKIYFHMYSPEFEPYAIAGGLTQSFELLIDWQGLCSQYEPNSHPDKTSTECIQWRWETSGFAFGRHKNIGLNGFVLVKP